MNEGMLRWVSYWSCCQAEEFGLVGEELEVYPVLGTEEGEPECLLLSSAGV